MWFWEFLEELITSPKYQNIRGQPVLVLGMFWGISPEGFQLLWGREGTNTPDLQIPAKSGWVEYILWTTKLKPT
jgi:hypothetical protein